MNSIPSNPSVTIITRSPGLENEAVDVVITVPTFKRPDLVLETLASLTGQTTGRRFAIIVMDNDAELREGAAAVKSLFDRGDLKGMVIIAHNRGNCFAYNAGWETAVACFPSFKYLLVIDDDEVAVPGWLDALCSTAERLDADVVSGPVFPVFPAGTDSGWAKHPVFTPAYDKTGVVSSLFGSGNLLVKREVLLALEPPYFDPRLNFMGGGDADLLSRISAKGFRLAWCQEAAAHENVPARRLEADWIRARSLRNGVISTLVEKRKLSGRPFANLRIVARSLGLLVASLPRSLGVLLKTGSPSAAMYHVYIALGRILAEFGYANEQYRNAEKN